MSRVSFRETRSADVNTNLQKSIRLTIHSIDGFKIGYLSKIDFNEWRDEVVRKNPGTKEVFDAVVPPNSPEKEFLKDDLVIKFTRYARNIYDDFVSLAAKDEELVNKARLLNNHIREQGEHKGFGFRTYATISIEVLKFEPDKAFSQKFGNIVETMKVKFMFENQIKDTERISTKEKITQETVL